MRILVLVLVIVTAIGFLGLASVPLLTPNTPTAPQDNNNTPNQNNDLVQAEFPGKVIYTIETEQDPAPYRADCQARGGEFNECGNACAPDAEVCAEVCAYTCELPSPSSNQLINVSQPQPNAVISSPLTITGEARGNWYFEASFSVRLLDGNGNEVPLTPPYIMTEHEWMTTNFVPFEATLKFTNPGTDTGTLILEKANPSGLAEHADEVRIPVRLD